MQFVNLFFETQLVIFMCIDQFERLYNLLCIPIQINAPRKQYMHCRKVGENSHQSFPYCILWNDIVIDTAEISLSQGANVAQILSRRDFLNAFLLLYLIVYLYMLVKYLRKFEIPNFFNPLFFLPRRKK